MSFHEVIYVEKGGVGAEGYASLILGGLAGRAKSPVGLNYGYSPWEPPASQGAVLNPAAHFLRPEVLRQKHS